MNLSLRHAWWRLLHVFNPRASWDAQFRAGQWGERDSARVAGSPTAQLVAEFCHGGTLVEWGCADGDLPAYLPAGSFASYLGFDISTVAIARAEARHLGCCHFAARDMRGWRGTSNASLILVEECIYYLNAAEITRFIARCLASLAPGGHIAVIVHSRSKHAQALAACLAAGGRHEERPWGQRHCLLLTAHK